MRNFPEEATDYYYKFSQDSDYIRRYRVAKDLKWTVDTVQYGEIDITINLSKPEKDPKAIAAAKLCCRPAVTRNVCSVWRMRDMPEESIIRRERTIVSFRSRSIDSKWGFQYSPYVYYNEHCIVFNGRTCADEDRACIRLSNCLILSNYSHIISLVPMQIFLL